MKRLKVQPRSPVDQSFVALFSHDFLRRGSMWEWATTWFASEADLLRFCGFWSFFGLLGGLEALFPAMLHSAERGQRWPTNLGLGLVNIAIVPLAPVSAMAATEWAHTARIGLLNTVET